MNPIFLQVEVVGRDPQDEMEDGHLAVSHLQVKDQED